MVERCASLLYFVLRVKRSRSLSHLLMRASCSTKLLTHVIKVFALVNLCSWPGTLTGAVLSNRHI